MELDPKYDHYDFPTEAPDPKEGHPGNLTELQKASVHQLRMMLEAEGYTKRLDTLTLLRFLRARKFDVTLAKKMFVDTEKWRKEGVLDLDGQPEDLDKLTATWNWPQLREISQYYPQYYHKTDKDGRPVYIEKLGTLNLAAMAKVDAQYEKHLLTNLAVEYERMADPRLPACSRKAGHLLETCTTILDFKGAGFFGLGNAYGKVRPATEMSQNHYPERLGKLYLINTPGWFRGVYSFVQGWLDPVTVNKIKVFSSGWEEELRTQIPAENLPKEYGGTCECEGGCQYSDAGPWKEKEYYKPAKWETENTITNTEGEITTEPGSTGAAAGEHEAKAPAAA